jgi:hypothetical protein
MTQAAPSPIPLRRRPLARGHLAAIPLSDTEWRVSDDRLAPDDGRSVIGFVTRTQGVYEVVEFGDPVRFYLEATLEGALRHLGDAMTTEDTAVVTDLASRRPRPVPHAV